MKRALTGIAAVALAVSVGACGGTAADSAPSQHEIFEVAYQDFTAIPGYEDASEAYVHETFKLACQMMQADKESGTSADDALARAASELGLTSTEATIIFGGAVASSCQSLRDWLND